MKPSQMLCVLPLLFLFAGASAADASAVAEEPLRNADISAGDCEKDCIAHVLFGTDLFLLWKGEEVPSLLLPLGPVPSENAEALPTVVRGEINTRDCVASCEKALLVADLELTVQRDGDGEIAAVGARKVRFGNLRLVPDGLAMRSRTPSKEDDAPPSSPVVAAR